MCAADSGSWLYNTQSGVLTDGAFAERKDKKRALKSSHIKIALN